MTPQEKLHAVSTAIRKALPRLIEAREGCVIYNKNRDTYFKFLIIDKESKTAYKRNLSTGEITGTGFHNTDLESVIELSNDKIIGHDILLNDVLEWLGTLFHFSIDHKGIIYKEFDYYFEGGLDRDYTEVARVDFSKPYLKHQSEELWNFLYNLLEDNK